MAAPPPAPAPSTNRPYHYRRQGRSSRLAAAIFGWAALMALLLGQLQASLWVVLLLSLPVIPGIWEFFRNPTSGFDLDRDGISWFSPVEHQQVPLAEVAFVRLDTRWDFSTRVTVTLKNGHSLRVPPPATPPSTELESALAHFDLRYERHHFVVF